MTSNQSDLMNLPALRITCTSTDCASGLHCYKQKKKSAGRANGPCRTCGADLVDWDRVQARDLSDVEHTFEALKTELIRHYYWHVPLDEPAVSRAQRKGRAGLREAAVKRLHQSVGSAHPYRDGIQTPKMGNVLFYAQHATATCCRKCIEEWYGIPLGCELTGKELSYLTELVLLYVWERLPELTEMGEGIPTRRQRLISAERGRRQARAQNDTNKSRRNSDGETSSMSKPTGERGLPPLSAHERLLAAARRKRAGGDA